MPNEIRRKNITKATFTITLATLANAAARQSTMISNTNGYPAALVYLAIKSGATPPTAGTSYKVYLLRGNDPSSSNYRTDGAGASDAAMSTVLGAQLLGTIPVTAAANTVFYGEFDTSALGSLGPEWGIAILNNTGQAIHGTEGDMYKGYVYYVPEVQ